MKREFKFEYEYTEDGDVQYTLTCTDEHKDVLPTYEDLFGAIEIMRNDIIEKYYVGGKKINKFTFILP